MSNAARNTHAKLPGRSPAAFTLIELLVVVSIIALLVAILLPALDQARSRSRAVVCRSNMRQIAISLLVYAADNNGGFLSSYWPNASGFTSSWDNGAVNGGWLAPYYKNPTITHCPAVSGDQTVCNYSPTGISTGTAGGSLTRPDQMGSPSTVAMVGDETELKGTTSRNPYLFQPSSALISPPSSTNFYNNGFIGRHSGKGNVGWYDAHVDSEMPWITTSYLTASGIPAVVQTLIIQNHVGMLTPLASGTSYTDFMANTHKDDYFIADKTGQ